MKHIFGFIIAVVGLLGFASCSDNDYKYLGKENLIQIVESNILFTAEASNGELKFTAPSAVTATANKEWCHASVNGNILSVNVDANKDYEGRMAIVTLTCGASKQDVYVQQNGIIILFGYKTCTLDSIPSKGGDLVIERKSATDPVTCTSDAEWLKVTESENGYALTIDENKSMDARTAKITFSAPAHDNSAVYTIIQKGGDYVAPVLEGNYLMTYHTSKAEDASDAVSVNVTLTKDSKDDNLFYLSGLLAPAFDYAIPLRQDRENNQLVMDNCPVMGKNGDNWLVAVCLYTTATSTGTISYTQDATRAVYFDYTLDEQKGTYNITLHNSAAELIKAENTSKGFTIYNFSSNTTFSSSTRVSSYVSVRVPVLTQLAK